MKNKKEKTYETTRFVAHASLFQSNHRVKAMELPHHLTAITQWFDAHHFMI